MRTLIIFLTPEAVADIKSESNERGTTTKEKNAEIKWKRQPKFRKTKKCNLDTKILLNVPENFNPLKIYEATTDFSELVKYICEQTNLFAAQNGREFVPNPEEICAFLDITISCLLQSYQI